MPTNNNKSIKTIIFDIDKIKKLTFPCDIVIKFYYTQECKNKLGELWDIVDECGEEDMTFDNIDEVEDPDFMEWLVEQIEEGKEDYTHVSLCATHWMMGDTAEEIQVLWENENN